jgi:tricorn protease
MTSMARPQTGAVYVAVLRKDLPSPLAPQSDDENADKKQEDAKGKPQDVAPKAKEKDGQSGDKDKDKASPKVSIDFGNIGQRIIAATVPEKNYYAVTPGKEGVIYVQELPIVGDGRFRKHIGGHGNHAAKECLSMASRR